MPSFFSINKLGLPPVESDHVLKCIASANAPLLLLSKVLKLNCTLFIYLKTNLIINIIIMYFREKYKPHLISELEREYPKIEEYLNSKIKFIINKSAGGIFCKFIFIQHTIINIAFNW